MAKHFTTYAALSIYFTTIQKPDQIFAKSANHISGPKFIQLDFISRVWEMASVKFSTILNKYPTFRDDTVKGCWKWLNGRRADDNAEGYWRVHDKLYDLKDFVDKHPGGQEWLILTEV